MSSAPADRRIFNFPGWHDNPYVQLLQSEVVARGYELAGRPDFFDAMVELTSPERRGVIHVQWPSPVTEWAESSQDATRRVTLFLDALFSAKQWGRKIIFTLHNVLPHDTRFEGQAVRLHEGLVRHADVIHTISPHTAELAAEKYEVPAEKVVEIPHSSYDGIYGPALAQDEARAKLGARPDSTGVLFFGWIRPYKGIEHLVAASRIASEHGADIEVLLAGRPQGHVEHLLDELEQGPATVTSHLKRVLPEDVPVWFGAADVLVLPYRAILNSGNMFLAATYGVPVILPDEPHLVAEFGGEEWIRFFDRADADASLASLIEDPWFRRPEAREAARRFADARPPQRMAEQYADLVTSLEQRA